MLEQAIAQLSYISTNLDDFTEDELKQNLKVLEKELRQSILILKKLRIDVLEQITEI